MAARDGWLVKGDVKRKLGVGDMWKINQSNIACTLDTEHSLLKKRPSQGNGWTLLVKAALPTFI